MRLTLRTLLAYRDGVLSPADSEDLHRRIQLSQDAGNLLKRINSLSHAPHLQAPPVLGKGPGGDPNFIAEYLDDTLHGSKVPELEKTCLVSDVQLAELADCHELLSSALNTKVNVPPELREMALAIERAAPREEVEKVLQARRTPSPAGGILTRVDTRHGDGNLRSTVPPAYVQAVPIRPAQAKDGSPPMALGVDVQAPMVASGGGSIKPQGLSLEGSTLAHEVPEYLVGGSYGGWKIPLAIGGLLALLGILVWQTLGPWDRVAELFASAPKVKSSAGSSSGGSSPSIPREASNISTEPAPANEAADAKNDSESSTPPIPSPTLPAEIPAESQTPTSPLGPSTPPPALDGGSPPVPPIGSAETAAHWLPDNTNDGQAVVLMREQGGIGRAQPGEAFALGSRLVIPPVNRTTLDLSGGVLWTVCGPSLLEMVANPDETDPNAPAMVRTQLCRALIQGGPNGRYVRVTTPIGDWGLRLTDATSLASIEVAYRPTAAGSILDTRAYQPVLIIVAAEGTAEVQYLSKDANPRQKEVLALGEGYAVVGNRSPVRFDLKNIPTWYRTSVERPIDALAADDLDQYLRPNPNNAQANNVSKQLLDLTSLRRPETSALAIQTAMLIGNWQPLINGTFDNERLRSHWDPIITLARQLLAADPEQAKTLRQQWVQAGGQAGSLLFELLCGLPEDQLVDSSGLTMLIEQLESPQLENRVLAAYQLQNLTGKSLGFMPSTPQRASIQQWRRELTRNQLVLLPTRDPVWER